MMKLALGAFALVMMSLLPAAAQERFLKPVDEGPQDESFVQFREKALKAVAAKDAAFIKSILDPDVRVDFGGGLGVKGFVDHWKGLGAKSDFWSEFGFALSHGGEFLKMKNRGPKQFWAPYIYASFPEDLDSFEYAVIVGENVRLREAPDAKSKILSQLSYNIVKPDYAGSPDNEGTDDKPKWIKVSTLGGKTGYVSAEFVRSPIGYRAGFKKVGDKWRLTAFVAGD